MKDLDIFYLSKELNYCDEIGTFLSLMILIVGDIERSFF